MPIMAGLRTPRRLNYLSSGGVGSRSPDSSHETQPGGRLERGKASSGFQFALTFRAPIVPEANRERVARLLELGRRAIVGSFTRLTTDAMHQEWGQIEVTVTESALSSFRPQFSPGADDLAAFVPRKGPVVKVRVHSAADTPRWLVSVLDRLSELSRLADEPDPEAPLPYPEAVQRALPELVRFHTLRYSDSVVGPHA